MLVNKFEIAKELTIAIIDRLTAECHETPTESNQSLASEVARTYETLFMMIDSLEKNNPASKSKGGTII